LSGKGATLPALPVGLVTAMLAENDDLIVEAGRAVIEAFREQLQAGTLRPAQHATLLLLEHRLSDSLIPPSAAVPASSPPDAPAAASPGGLPVARPAEDVIRNSLRARLAAGLRTRSRAAPRHYEMPASR